ncbi:transposase [Pseudomonas sp. MDT1-16]|uniref:proline racemase family protein n=1 Tax=Pseudomonas sp. AL03 TaxID=3042230 RepID=UPI002499FE1D|nr:proline racemase family protein [Pseudomonas sp. AL03]MDI3273714.1 proline racemase family protein [Pseudomonas sp. AL03]
MSSPQSVDPVAAPTFRQFKRKVVEATFQSGASVSLIAREHDVNANLVFRWRQRVSARMAQLFGKGRLNVGDIYRLESLIGTIYERKVETPVKVGTFDGMKPRVSGWADVIGHNTIFVDDKDPLTHGFQLA